MQRKLIDKKGLKQELGIPYSYTHIYRLEAQGKFPKRVQLGECRVVWVYEEVVAWIDSRIALRA